MVLWKSTRPSRLTPKKDVLFIIEDWNAKVGSQELPGVTGKFGLGAQNEAGRRLTEFCQENTLVIANTLFQLHKRRLYTWTSPDGQYRNQIDSILCNQRWRSSTQSAKTIPGADCGSDHELVITKFRLKLKKVGKTTSPFRYAAAKSLQLCLTLHDLIEGSPPGSSVPGILQARILEWVALFFSSSFSGMTYPKSLRVIQWKWQIDSRH